MRILTSFTLLVTFFLSFMSSCSSDGIGKSSPNKLIVADTIRFSPVLGRGNISKYDSRKKQAIGLFSNNNETILGIWNGKPVSPQAVSLSNSEKGLGGMVMGYSMENDSACLILYNNKVMRYDLITDSTSVRASWVPSNFFAFPPFSEVLTKTTMGGENAFLIRSYDFTVDKNSIEFFETTKGLTCVPEHSGQVKAIAGFREDGVYRDRVINTMFNVIYDVQGDSIFYIRPFERKSITVSTCDDGVVRSIPVKAEHHTDFIFEGSPVADNMLRYKQDNSYYLSIVVRGDFIYTQYLGALNPEDTFDNVVEMNESKVDRLSYVDIYDKKSGEGIRQSIVVPGCMYKLLDANGTEDLYFSKRGQCTDQLEIYHCEIL